MQLVVTLENVFSLKVLLNPKVAFDWWYYFLISIITTGSFLSSLEPFGKSWLALRVHWKGPPPAQLLSLLLFVLFSSFCSHFYLPISASMPKVFWPSKKLCAQSVAGLESATIREQCPGQPLCNSVHVSVPLWIIIWINSLTGKPFHLFIDLIDNFLYN